MRRLTTPREEQRLLTAVASAERTALLTEVVELRARNEQLGRALGSLAEYQVQVDATRAEPYVRHRQEDP